VPAALGTPARLRAACGGWRGGDRRRSPHAITDGDVVALLGVADWPGSDAAPSRRDGEGNVVVVWENGATRVLVDSDDVAADGAPYGSFYTIMARGNHIAFAASLRRARRPTRSSGAPSRRGSPQRCS
jgi:hypothetical protein